MRRKVLWVMAVLLALGAIAAAAEDMSVTVKEAPVRDRASFTGRVVGTLVYADRVTVRETRGDWVHISLSAKGVDGWMPKSALQTQRIVLRAGGEAGTAASSGEVALAGKGFNEEVESEYRKNPDLNYTAVDDMEAFTVSTEAVAAFLEEGGMSVGGEKP